MAKKPTEVEIAKENIRHAVWQDTPEKEVKIGNVVLLKYDPDTHGMYLATDGYTLEKILGRIGPIPENGISVSIRMEMSVEADYLYQRVDGIGCLPRNDSPVPFRWTARKADCISPEAWERKQLNLITDLIKEREDGQNRIKQIIGIDSSPNKGIVESLVKTTVSCDSKLRDVLERTTRDVFKRCYAMGYREGNAALPGYDKDVVEKTKCYLTKAYETLSRR